MWDIKGKRRRGHDQYMSETEHGTYNYDLFILVLSGVVDAVFESLFNEVLRFQRKFLVVRTCIDEDIRRGANQNREEAHVFGSVRTQLLGNLRNLAPDRMNDLRLFLVNNYDTDRHDFAQFRQALLDMCHVAKREALIYQLNVTCDQVLQMKYEELKKRIPTVSQLAAISTGVPVLGSFMESAEVILTREIFTYMQQFGLDRDSVQALEIANRIQGGQLEEFVRRSLKDPVLTGIREGTLAYSLAGNHRTVQAVEQVAAFTAGMAAICAKMGGALNSWQAGLLGALW